MIRNRLLLKSISVFLILETLFNTIAPTISWALTSGPTAPEATSFEPIDTTDLVNHVTGDLAYNIPLLEVPGPSGGFPLSLSYHAGIMPNEDASWVGLGFSLNPGAINRSVSGYADDHYNVMGSSRDFWEGGKSESLTIGVNISSAAGTSVSAGLTFSEDTYKGSGVGYYYGVGASDKRGSQGLMTTSGVSYQAGVSPYGESYSSSGVGVGIGAGSKGFSGMANLGMSIDNNTGKVSGRASVGVSYSKPAGQGQKPNTSFSLLDASISTSQSASVSAGGVSSSVHNAKSGNISTRGYNYSVDIPTPWGFEVRLGKSYQRYWIDETVSVATNGALNFPMGLPTTEVLDRTAYDVYDLMDTGKPLSTSAADESLVGSFIDYDNYQVVGQGIGGNIKPYHYKSYLLRQNKKANNEYRVKSYPLAVNKKPHFRFIGDFSNRYTDPSEQESFNINTSDKTNPLSFRYQHASITGETGSDGYDADKNFLPGSKHVEYFTNISIHDKNRVDEDGNAVPVPADAAINRGFIETTSAGFVRPDDSQIGGFKVTNESGVTYHYSLPVLSSREYTYSGRVDEKNKHHFNTYKRQAGYAYTWLLTTMTGPDYIDRNSNGLADQGDWGYWVNFEYGMWSGKYSWRNPSQGFNKDIDQNFNNFSKGKKEVYYLNAIKTASHTALFVKEIRLDGKGVVEDFEGAVKNGNDHSVEDIEDGGFTAKTKKTITGKEYTEYPVSPLKLTGIYLLKNSDLEGVSNIQSLSNGYYYNNNILADAGKYIAGKNVIDIYDAAVEPLKTVLSTKSLKTILFNTDYSLCPSTANSFKSDLDVSIPDDGSPNGKLTLKSIKILGKGGASLLPETKFSYDIDEQFSGHLHGSSYDRISVSNVTDLNINNGDILKFLHNKKDYYVYVTGIEPLTSTVLVKPLNFKTIPFTSSITAMFRKTKNPPYSKDHYDLWGMYKVDYQSGESENISRMVTSVSAAAVDVWSLREITSSLGAKTRIEYESDTYTSTLKSLSNIPIKNIEALPFGRTKVYLYENLQEYNLENDDLINLRLVTALKYEVRDPGTYTSLRFHCNGDKEYVWKWIEDNYYTTPQLKLPIHSIDKNSFIIDYSFRDRFPTAGSLCMDKDYPYVVRDASSGTPSCIDMDRLDFSEFRFMGGEILSDKVFSPYGGGIRVKKVSIAADSKIRSTTFQYENGVTTYEPLGFAMPIRKLPPGLKYPCLDDLEQQTFDSYRQKYFTDVYKKFQFLFANSRELPGPGVMYEQVTVRDQIERPTGIVDIQGKSVYLFEVFSPKTIDIKNEHHGALVDQFKSQFGQGIVAQRESNYSGTPLGLNVKLIETRNHAIIKDFSSIMGSLKKITLYDKDNNKITETQNHYLHDNFSQSSFLDSLAAHKNQGVITETFADARIIVNPEANPKNYTLFGLISQKIKYPSIQTGTTTINYKTGITTQTTNRAYDFYSGQVTQTVSKDGYGNTYLTETVPAYKKYPEMGLAYAGGKNMLIQEASAYSYKIDPRKDRAHEKLGLLAASVQTWSDQVSVLQPGKYVSEAEPQEGIWRKLASYSFIGNDQVPSRPDGLYPASNVNEFDAWNLKDAVTDNWQKNAEITLYDIHSHALEAKDLNNQFAATKMVFDQTKVNATAANAEYREFGYSNAEERPARDFFGSDVILNSKVYAPVAHTGTKALSVQPGTRAFTFSMAPKKRTYRVSVWSSQPTCSFKYKFDANNPQNAAVKNKGRAGNWYLLEADIPVTESLDKIEIWCEAEAATSYFDDFRVHPVDAPMTSYVYNAWDELTHILDNNNLYTEYRYDEVGRLKSTHRETFQTSYGNFGVAKTSETVYNYGVKNPFTITISASSSGTSGAISPAGETNILQGGSQVFAIAETCSSPKVLRILIDNKPINITSTNTTLWDGTQVVYSNGQLILKNVQSPHTLKAEFFTSLGGGGGVSCHYNDRGCASGDYDYYIIDNCGDRVYREDVPWELIPAEFKPATRPTCKNIQGSDCGTRN